MLSDTVINLISQVYSVDSVGNQISTDTARQVYASRRPISRSEFFTAQTAGIKAEHLFVISSLDYEGERLVEYAGEKFTVYRVYENEHEQTELYVERRLGDYGE